jgi:hypothetical protein
MHMRCARCSALRVRLQLEVGRAICPELASHSGDQHRATRVSGKYMVQEFERNGATLGTSDRSWLSADGMPGSEPTPRTDSRMFFSIAPDQFAIAGDNSQRYWRTVPGQANVELVEAAPDAFSLQRIVRASADLALIAMLVRPRQPVVADLAESTALRLIDGPFLSTEAIRPTMEWARAQPRDVNLTATGWRLNPEGFMDMNPIVALLDTVQLLNATRAQKGRLDSWLQDYSSWLSVWQRRNSERFGNRGTLWMLVQQAAMARYLGEHHAYDEHCSGCGQLIGTLISASGSLV